MGITFYSHGKKITKYKGKEKPTTFERERRKHERAGTGVEFTKSSQKVRRNSDTSGFVPQRRIYDEASNSFTNLPARMRKRTVGIPTSETIRNGMNTTFFGNQRTLKEGESASQIAREEFAKFKGMSIEETFPGATPQQTEEILGEIAKEDSPETESTLRKVLKGLLTGEGVLPENTIKGTFPIPIGGVAGEEIAISGGSQLGKKAPVAFKRILQGTEDTSKVAKLFEAGSKSKGIGIITPKLPKQALKAAGIVAGGNVIANWFAADNIATGAKIDMGKLVSDVKFGVRTPDEAIIIADDIIESFDTAKNFITTSTILNPALWAFGNFYRSGVKSLELGITNDRLLLEQFRIQGQNTEEELKGGK